MLHVESPRTECRWQDDNCSVTHAFLPKLASSGFPSSTFFQSILKQATGTHVFFFEGRGSLDLWQAPQMHTYTQDQKTCYHKYPLEVIPHSLRYSISALQVCISTG